MIGASMGGLVGKYCLLHMHNVQGKDSEVERFFTYDTPLTGANFPVGLQLMIRDLVNLSASTASDPNIVQALQLIDGPAASQMLRQKAIIDANGNLALSSAGFDALQEEIDAMNAIRPLSAIVRHIALSNGAGNGTAQETVTDDIAMEFSLQLDGVVGGGAPYWQYDILITGTAFAARTTTTLLYSRQTLIFPITGGFNIEESASYVHPFPLGLDVAPGGNSNVGLAQLQGALEMAFENIEDQIAYDVDMPITHFCFVPTVSSLGLPVSASLFAPTAGGVASRSSVSLDNSVTSNFSQLPEFNQEHVSMNVRIADVMVDELKPATVTVLDNELANGEIYNFGRSVPATSTSGVQETPRTISQDLTIGSGAQLWLNRDDRIGYTNNLDNPQNRTPQQFTVSVPGASCLGNDPVRVLVENGGKIKVGEYDNGVLNIGKLRFGKSSELVVNGPEAMLIDKHSILAIENSATMTIEPGAQVLAADLARMIVQNGSEVVIRGTLKFTGGADCVVSQNSRVHIKAGGTLHITSDQSMLHIREGGTLILDPGAIVHVESPNSNIRIEGTLMVNGNFTFQGRGHFDFWNDKGLELGPQADAFRLFAHPTNTRSIRLSNNTHLWMPPSKGLHLNNGGVEYTNNNSLVLQQGSWVEADNAQYVGYNRGATGIQGQEPGRILLQDCQFDGVDQPLDISGANNFNLDLTRIRHTRFVNYDMGTRIAERGVVLFDHCTLLGTGFGAPYGIFSDNNYSLTLRECNIGGHLSSHYIHP